VKNIKKVLISLILVLVLFAPASFMGNANETIKSGEAGISFFMDYGSLQYQYVSELMKLKGDDENWFITECVHEWIIVGYKNFYEVFAGYITSQNICYKVHVHATRIEECKFGCQYTHEIPGALYATTYAHFDGYYTVISNGRINYYCNTCGWLINTVPQ